MFCVNFAVMGKPPYKQTPADTKEKEAQEARAEALISRAKEECEQPTPCPCFVAVRYARKEGKADGGNIVNGVLDALEATVYENDRQVVVTHYVEGPSDLDWYQVIVAELQTEPPAK